MSSGAERHDTILREAQAWARAHAAGEAEGLFGPDSVTWRVGRELLLMGAGGRALVLQLANPVVAEGVEGNSNFKKRMIQRARRTFVVMFAILFGDLDRALKAGERAHGLHRVVRGTISARTCPDRAGEVFFANDPENLRWVMATLLDSSVLIYEQVVGPLSLAEKDRYTDEYRRLGAAMGMPPELLPDRWADFQAYWDRMVREELYVGETMKELCDILFNSPLTAGRLDEILTLGMLPPSLVPAVDYPWDDRARRRHAAVMRSLRAVVPRLPASVRYAPAWHQAVLRLAGEDGPRPLQSRLVGRIDRYLDLPFSL